MTLTETRRYAIGGVQVYGGLLGAGKGLDVIQQGLSPVNTALMSIAVAMFLLSFLAGILLLRGHRWGAPMSMWMQVPQLVGIFSPVMTAIWYSGIRAGVVIGTSSELTFQGNFGSLFSFGIATGLEDIDVSLNFAAAFTLWQLFKVLEAQDGKGQPQPASTLGGMT